MIIITLLIVGLIFRKRIYDSVDRQEMWKMDIMNRNTAAELARIKGLNLSGETQEKFESWKERWEFIVAKELPDISEMLFEAEDAADRYRFPTSRKIIQKVDHTLNVIEDDIKRMLGELEELLESEQTSQQDIEVLQPKLRDLQQSILQERNQYGRSVPRFTERLEEIETGSLTYDELVEAGNYLEAKDFVDQLKEDFRNLEDEVKEFPTLLKMCTHHLPSQLDKLSSGLKTMKEYRVEHLGFDQEIHNYEQRLLDCVQSLEKGTTSEVKTIIEEIEERITEMYDLLEEEALAKNYIETQLSNYEQLLKELVLGFNETKEEVEVSRKSYFFEDHDMEKYHSLEKAVTHSKNESDKFKQDLDDEEKAHSNLRVQLEEEMKRLKDLDKRHQDFKEKVRSLRKDELEAQEKLSEMRKQVNDLKRKLKRSNLPGIPNFILHVIESAVKSNDNVMKKLDKQPLDIAAVNHALDVAESAVDDAIEQTDVTLDQAYLTEQVIQYANRYRSTYPLLAAKLSESERLFRSFEYELSLEHAASAIEEVEPGALKQIEANQVAMLS